MSDHRIPKRHPDTAFRIFDGEAVIISPTQNMVRMLNPTGSRIWELADGSRSIAEIAAILTEEFEVRPEHAPKSARDFVLALVERDLMTLNSD